MRAAAAILCLLASRPVRAQPRPGSIEIGGGGGRLYGGSFARGSNEFFDRRVDVDDDIAKGFWVGTQLTRDWGIEIGVRRTATAMVEHSQGVFPTKPTVAGLDFATIDLTGMRSFRLGAFCPYIGAGVGLANLDINVPDVAVRDSNRLTVTAGAGGRFYAAQWIGVRIDVRGRATYLGRRRLGEDRGWDDSGRWLTGAEILGGVFLSFGGRE